MPRPQRHDGLNPERPWLPLFVFGLWTAGSAVHAACVAYICKLPNEVWQFAPIACVAAWTAWNRRKDFVREPSSVLEQGLLLLAFFMPVLAFGKPRLFLALAGLNALAFGVLWLTRSGSTRRLAEMLTLASVPFLLAGLPEEWGRMLTPGFTRTHGSDWRSLSEACWPHCDPPVRSSA